MCRLTSIAAIAAMSLVSSGCGSIFYMGQHPSVSHDAPRTQMKEEVRDKVSTVKVVADGRKPNLVVSGDYGEVLPTAGDGAKAGAKAGAQVTGEMIAADPRFIFLAPVVLPFAMITGSVTGAAAAKIQQEIQEFREGLADELALDDGRPQPGDRLAEVLTAYLEASADVAPVAAGADAELTVWVTHIEINTHEEDALIVTNVRATLRDTGDGSILYEQDFEYAERSSLRKWTADDSAAWLPYADNARRFLAAEVAAALFERIHVRHVLRPVKTGTFSGDWVASLRSAQPTLAWELFLLDEGPHGAIHTRADLHYELQIFDAGRLVYSARDIPGTSHEVSTPLQNCRSLSWSVRPVYHVDGKTRTGDWMYMQSGFDKLQASVQTNTVAETLEFWEHFAKLRTRCSS